MINTWGIVGKAGHRSRAVVIVIFTAGQITSRALSGLSSLLSWAESLLFSLVTSEQISFFLELL